MPTVKKTDLKLKNKKRWVLLKKMVAVFEVRMYYISQLKNNGIMWNQITYNQLSQPAACATLLSSSGLVLPINAHGKGWKLSIAIADSMVHGADMEPTWILSASDGPHVGPMNLAIRVRLPAILLGGGSGNIRRDSQRIWGGLFMSPLQASLSM